MYSDGRPVSLVGLQQMIGGRLSILIVGVAREVVVLLSFRFDLSRSLRLPNVPNGATNKATKGFMDGCSNIWLHYRHSWTHLRPESTLNRPQSRTKRSLDTKNGQFTHLLIFFLCVRAMSLEDAWKRTSKVVTKSNRYHHTTYRYNSDSFTKFWRQETSCRRLVVLYSSELFDDHRHVHFIQQRHRQQRSGIAVCFGDNTMVRGCLCSLKVRRELSQREITFFSGNLSRRSIIITSQFMTHLHLFRSRIMS